MHLYKSFILLCISLLSCALLSAQVRIGNQFQSEVLQRSAWNPAAMQDVKVQLSFGSVQPFVGSNSFSIGDLIKEVPGDSLEISFDDLANSLEPFNVFRSDFELDGFWLAISLENPGLQIGFSTGVKYHSQLGFDDDLVSLLVRGNEQFVGQTVEVGPQLSMMAYTDIGLSVAKKIGKILQLGARFRYLNGIATLNTVNHQASLTTSSEYYQIGMEVDYELQSSFPNVGVLDSLVNGQNNEFNFDPQDISFSPNNGFALDLSAIVTPTENLEFGAGVQGLGGINWQNNARSYVSRGNFTFEGAEPKDNENQPLIEKLLDLDFSGLADTITNSFEVESQDQNFRTAIPRRYFINGMYSPVDRLQLGASYQLEFFGDLSHTTMGLYAGLKLNHGFSLGLTYGNDSNFGGFLGLHGHANLGPIQVFSSIDNINSIIDPLNAQAFTMRAGMNLLIGKRWKGKNGKGSDDVIRTDL